MEVGASVGIGVHDGVFEGCGVAVFVSVGGNVGAFIGSGLDEGERVVVVADSGVLVVLLICWTTAISVGLGFDWHPVAAIHAISTISTTGSRRINQLLSCHCPTQPGNQNANKPCA
jgi:hypothetical protein